MTRLEVEVPGSATRSYPVVVTRGDGPARLAELAAALLPSRTLLVADATVLGLHGGPVREALRPAGEVAVPPGEGSKSPAGLEQVWRALHAAGLDRDGVVVALGGGVTGDLAGFAAATWLRGVRVVHAPTTLLAMVDSAIGGKTGLDLDGKNLVGAFHAPSGVVADLAWLATLPARERRCGLAEAWKTAALAGEAQVERLEALAGRPGDEAALLAVVLDCARHKAGVVARDEREAGERASLNLGHTLAHALEAWTIGSPGASPGGLLHGEAVAIGVAFALRLARATGRLAPEVEARLLALGRALGLDLAAPAGATLEGLRPWLARDKKARAGAARWVLPTGLGGWTLAEVDDAALARTLAETC